MTMIAAPHPASVFRYLKQAYRDYLSSGNAITLTVTANANQAASAPLTASGTLATDVNVPQPVSVSVFVQQGGVNKGSFSVFPNAAGAWSHVFPANTAPAGLTVIIADTIYGPGISGPAFTLS